MRSRRAAHRNRRTPAAHRRGKLRDLLWPEMLLRLLAVPVLVSAYRGAAPAAQARRDPLREPDPDAGGARPRPAAPPARSPLLFLLALIAAIVAIARPSAVITLPSQVQTIVLAMDVSLSMGAKDVDPNRLTAAQVAAKSFIEQHPPNARIAIVAFGATAVARADA